MTSDLVPPDEDDQVRPDARIVGREARLMERITEDMRVKGRTADEALDNIADAVRYTFQYPAERYTEAVHAHIERLWGEGHTELTVRNCWACDTWKGISTSWQDRRTGQLFEVQFHTPESLAARDLTYPAYRRLRDAATSDAERGEIMAYLRRVYAGAPASHAPPAERERASKILRGSLPRGSVILGGAGGSLAWDGTANRIRPATVTSAPRGHLSERVAYYSVTDRHCAEDVPAGVLRRVEHADGQRDEAFGRDLRWRHTFLLYSWERGNLDNMLQEVSADRAMRITDQIRREVTY